MGRFVNKGNDGFASVRNSNYVDKSMLIDEINSVLDTENRFLCVTRARRFGKSVAIKMLNAYFDKSSSSEKLFEGLAISKTPDYRKHLNRYPVLYIDMTDFVTKYGAVDDLVSIMKRDISEELAELYPDVSVRQSDDLMDFLVNIVERTGQKFICLIDEWDALCREGHDILMDEYVDFLRRLFKGSKTEYVFSCVYMTGILPIKRYNTQSALNNFEEYSMLSPAQLAPYFGFTEDEVVALCKASCMDRQEMKRWYDGYQIGHQKAMYNPYAVMRAIKRRSFESYWASTNSFENLRHYITMNFAGLKDDIVSALNDVPVSVNSLRFSNDMHKVECRDDVLTLLCHLGYLSFSNDDKSAVVPNFEVRQEFEAAIADTGWAEVTEALQQSESLLKCVLDMDAEIVARMVGAVHDRNVSVLRYNDENSLACVLSLAFYTARSKYQMIRELPTGRGFADIVLLPHRNTDTPAIVLELKCNKDANAAIQQIKRNDYPDTLLSYCGEVILVGINYDIRSKQHDCVIEKISKSNTYPPKSNTKSPKSNTKSPKSNTYGGLTRHQIKVLEFCSEEPHSAGEIFSHLGISKQSKHYSVYVNNLVEQGYLSDVTPDVERGKKYKKR